MEPDDLNLSKEPQQEEPTPPPMPDKSDYMRRISELSAEDQAFMDGYLFAKVTEAAKKGA